MAAAEVQLYARLWANQRMCNQLLWSCIINDACLINTERLYQRSDSCFMRPSALYKSFSSSSNSSSSILSWHVSSATAAGPLLFLLFYLALSQTNALYGSVWRRAAGHVAPYNSPLTGLAELAGNVPEEMIDRSPDDQWSARGQQRSFCNWELESTDVRTRTIADRCTYWTLDLLPVLLALNADLNLNCLHLLPPFRTVQHHRSAPIRVLCDPVRYINLLVVVVVQRVKKCRQSRRQWLRTENITSSSVRGTMLPSVKSSVMCEASNIRAIRVIQTSKKPDLISISWSSWHNSCWNSAPQSICDITKMLKGYLNPEKYTI